MMHAGDTMSTLGDIMSISGDVQYMRGIMMYVGFQVDKSFQFLLKIPTHS